ncbi:hypothetical protein ST47_g996 [Ascochyta rabiei]|uniref:Uncharacterized protein n=1 Tax=Didymella rabiei TaxID=5454 RepID=A0A163LJY7_DIDRA|nr:hypothetical protein ST47_g996 [Ascochyta rabiei]
MSVPNIPCVTNSEHSLNVHNFHPPPSGQTALPLHIPPCVTTPPHRFHLPLREQPLRIHAEGPLLALQKLLPEVSWHLTTHSPEFLMCGGPKLAELVYQKIYGRKARPDVAGDMVVRDEYMGWIPNAPPMIDYYGVTFDHLVPADDTNPEVLQINIVEIEDDAGMYAIQYNRFEINPADYIGKQVLVNEREGNTI